MKVMLNFSKYLLVCLWILFSICMYPESMNLENNHNLKFRKGYIKFEKYDVPYRGGTYVMKMNEQEFVCGVGIIKSVNCHGLVDLVGRNDEATISYYEVKNKIGSKYNIVDRIYQKNEFIVDKYVSERLRGNANKSAIINYYIIFFSFGIMCLTGLIFNKIPRLKEGKI